MSKMSPVHPGEILKSDFMEPFGLSSNKLATLLDVPANRISSIVGGKRSITGDTALRLAEAFGTTAEFWMNLQAAYDLENARDKTEENALRSIKRVTRAA